MRNILSFRRDYPDATVVTLEQNYRSTQVILDAAHAVIRHNTDRAAKKLWTDRSGGELVRLISVYDEQEEALAVCGEIEMLIGREGFSLSDCAVLYRTNAQSRAFEDVLLRRGIPYRLVGGLRFYERREVKDVLAYLRLVANPRDSVSFGRVVNVPRRKIGDRTVAELERAGAPQAHLALRGGARARRQRRDHPGGARRARRLRPAHRRPARPLRAHAAAAVPRPRARRHRLRARAARRHAGERGALGQRHRAGRAGLRVRATSRHRRG